VQRAASLGPHRQCRTYDQGRGENGNDEGSIAHDGDGMNMGLNGP
jgi:hypothetical protein